MCIIILFYSLQYDARLYIYMHVHAECRPNGLYVDYSLTSEVLVSSFMICVLQAAVFNYHTLLESLPEVEIQAKNST